MGMTTYRQADVGDAAEIAAAVRELLAGRVK